MINHARTLLLNRDGVGYHGYVGEEYTPTDFHAVTLPSYCNDLRMLLFGQRPDWLMYNFRAYQLMTMLHATELEQFVLDLDSRITYDTSPTARPFYSVFPFRQGARGSTNVIGLNGTTAGLYPLTHDEAPDAVGQCYQQWSVELTATQFRMTHETTPRRFTLATATFTNGLSDIVQLPESAYTFRADEVPGSEWCVEAYTMPQRGLGDLEAAAGNLGEETITSLFRITEPQGAQEPYQTFKNLWYDHNETPYRLGAIVLALIYCTHNIWDVG